MALREQLSQRASELAALRQHNAELSSRSMRLEADLAHEVQGATVVQQELLVVVQERDSLRAGLQRWGVLLHAGIRCCTPSFDRSSAGLRVQKELLLAVRALHSLQGLQR